MLLKGLFWGSLGALAWTHVGYPAAAALAARVRRRPVSKGGLTPRVTVIVAAYDEERVIERRLENLLALDYPPELVEIVVASDASSDRTDELVEAIAAREPPVRPGRAPPGGEGGGAGPARAGTEPGGRARPRAHRHRGGAD